MIEYISHMAEISAKNIKSETKFEKFYRNICIYESSYIYSHVKTINLNIIYS